MRDSLIPLVLIVVVIAGVWIYFETSLTHAGPVATSPAPADTPAPAAPKKVEPHPKRVIARDSSANATPSVPASPPLRVEDKPATPRPAPRPIPTGTLEQVNPGMEVSKVVELLGEPDLTALSIRRGSLSETYIYKRKLGQNLAFIRLEGGRVVPPQ
jgi:hypothetical protein